MSDLLKNTFVVVLGSMLLWGCAAQKAFQEGEKLTAAGRYDQAIEYYAQAVEENPLNHEFRMKLHDAKSRAATSHLQAGRKLMAEKDLRGAAEEFRLAVFLDPTLVAGNQDLEKIQNWFKAEELVREAGGLFEQRRFPQAKNLLERALQMQPENQQALDLIEKVRKEQMHLLDGYELDLISTEPITLKFQGVEPREAFNILSRLSGINFIFDEGVAADRVTIFLEKATFAQALDILLKMNNLGKRVLNSKTIILFPKTDEKLRQYEDHIIQVFYLSNIDAKKAVNMLRLMLQLRKIFVHEELNALVIRDKPDVIKLAQQILEAADRTDSEVVFDLELVEVSHGDALLLGPKLSSYSVSAGFGNESNIVLDTLSPGVSTDNLISGFGRLESFYTLPSATFEFAKTLTDTEILANPKIRVKNKEKAKIHIGTREPIATTSTSGDIVSTNVQYVDVGVKLDIEPMIQLDGTVVTNLTLEVSNVSSRETIAESGTTLLTITTTNAASALILKDGERTIMGGLIRDDRSTIKTTIPFLGKIPILGNLLSHRDRNNTKREILLSITPHIVRKMDMPRPEVATIWSGGENDPVAGNRFESFAKVFEPAHEQTPFRVAPANVTQTGPSPPVAEVAGRIKLQAPPVVEIGETFILTVSADEQEALHSAPLILGFPPGQLEVVSIDEGDLLGQGGATTLFSSSIDRNEGRILVNYNRQPGMAGVSGSGSLVKVTFQAKAAGKGSLELVSGSFQDAAGQTVPMEPVLMTIEVRADEATANSAEKIP
jgi:general secretion pathway protein D